ncbi:hypothetical protein PVAND_002026 [Polypedilum vanderplanki]|uniref:Mitochondrial nucleoid factor 1 n=1 Tax=Polypedilum vanderplanki TaxID=319348 RepID=A0A9J6BQ96_POLVA|nr:hypothetical protein PVAND_002026 [Polypedilum vanderplanki]
MSQHYKRFLAILEKWPVDKTKQGRDLGQFLREKLIQDYNITSTSKLPKNAEKQLESLENIVKNIHHDKYLRKYNSTSTGLTGEQCRQVLSSEFLEYINNEK